MGVMAARRGVALVSLALCIGAFPQGCYGGVVEWLPLREPSWSPAPGCHLVSKSLVHGSVRGEPAERKAEVWVVELDITLHVSIGGRG